MSIKSWTEEFLSQPQPTSEVAGLIWSIHKWEGARQKNLDKHNVKQDGSHIEEKDGLSSQQLFGSGTCPLCCTHGDNDSCFNCPLFKVRGDVICYNARTDEKESPYNMAIGDTHDEAYDPEPMIDWLKKTLAYVRRENKRKKK